MERILIGGNYFIKGYNVDAERFQYFKISSICEFIQNTDNQIYIYLLSRVIIIKGTCEELIKCINQNKDLIDTLNEIQ